MRFAFYTLGCKTNQYETQAMERLLTQMGHEIGHFDEGCDAYIINTCSVTAVADKKNRAIIRRCRKTNPDAIIGVCLQENSKNPVEIMEKLMSMPFCHRSASRADNSSRFAVPGGNRIQAAPAFCAGSDSPGSS